MAKTELRTSPDNENTGYPPGVLYIVGNEACERFSFYGMRAILYIHLAHLYKDVAGMSEQMANAEATATAHMFNAGVYAFPMIGALLADRLAGKFNTIFWLSMVYCAGHGVLAVGEETLGGMYLGLALIAIGSGGIKPCVSANVGDQFGSANWFRVRTIYQIFYFSINFGSVFATLLIPYLRTNFSTGVAFGVPGILMAIATAFFWAGQKKFVHVPPKPAGKLGLLDTVSGSLMFMAIGHFFVSGAIFGESAGSAQAVLSLVFMAAGIALFFYRQSLEQDDGFLAIMLYNLRELIAPSDQAASTGAVGGDGSSAGVPGASADEGDADGDEELSEHQKGNPLRTSEILQKIWGPAIKRFGYAAAEGPHAVLKVCTIFIFIPIFWALFDQHSSTWIEQAKHMNRWIELPIWGLIEFDPSQVPFLNPAMVMILIPVMNVVYSSTEKYLKIDFGPLRRMVLGTFIAGGSFAIVAVIQQYLEANGDNSLHVYWQMPAYLTLTASEVMVSITSLEFAYTQAPKRMKSTVMGLYLLTVAGGNTIVALVAKASADLELSTFFWVFTIAPMVVGALFGVRAYFYKERDFPQE